MRAAKVVSMYAGVRRNYNNNPETPAQVLGLWKHLIRLEGEIDPGCEVDTILVHNEDGCPEAREMLSDLHQTPTLRGCFRHLPRGNTGGSFGAYLDAYRTFRYEYDYWMFMEDDVYMISGGYLSAAIDQLDADPDLGFIALAPIDTSGERHSGGGFGVTSSDRLERAIPLMKIQNGTPPGYLEMEQSEIEFTTSFVRAGMRLENLIGVSPFCENWSTHNSQSPRFQEDNLPRIYRVGL